MTSTERAVRKASGERLWREMRQAVQLIYLIRRVARDEHAARDFVLSIAAVERSRTRYACLMTAFGQ